MRRYIFNYFEWWFVIQPQLMIKSIYLSTLHLLQITNTLPMMQHWREPLYQDYSSIGKLMGFLIRTPWIVLGSALAGISVLLGSLLTITYLMLPVFGVIMIGFSFIL